MKRAKKENQPQNTAQQLGSIVKSARDIMRKDTHGCPPGWNGAAVYPYAKTDRNFTVNQFKRRI